MIPAVDAAEVIAVLTAPAEDRRTLMDRLEADAPVAALAGALAAADERLTRQLAADLLGRRADPAAGPALLAALADPESRVRSSAADALGKVLLNAGSHAVPDAGPALLRAYDAETERGARHMLAAALGAAHHREAIPLLRRAAQSPDAGLARTARWALDQLGRRD